TDTAADTAPPSGGVVVNEVIAAALDGGDDRVELMNRDLTAAADVSGWSLGDDGGHTWVIPPGTTIPAGGLLVFAESDFGFGLGESDAVYLTDAAGAEVDVADWERGEASLGWSFGRLPDGLGAPRTLNTPTPGAPNAEAAVADVVVNEIVAADEGGGDDWVELVNLGAAAVSLDGWQLGDDGGNRWTFPDEPLAPGAYRVIAQSDFGFGLGKADAVVLITPAGVVAQSTSWEDGEAAAGTSWGRSPTGVGAFGTLATVSPGAANPE
ncbi:MAG: lamin tail domain-containing protein, partial [Myxococcales bacterium]|nr:lamin tail domain-containing protein [Myxococcales bacterium]